MADTFFTQPQMAAPAGNYWASLKAFSDRGGFVNGLNPSIVSNVWYVNGNSVNANGVIGSDANNGQSPTRPFATVARAFQFVKSYDTIVIDGVIREQVLAPLGVFDVTIIGAANRPRQATSNGVPTGGGAFWTFPSVSPIAATALLTLRQQGWSIYNIAFTPYTSSPCIEGIRAESATYPDPSHLTISGCAFLQGTTGIGFQDSGGLYNVVISNCRFFSLTTAIKGIAGAGIATPLQHQYLNNQFISNVNDIIIGSSFGLIAGNTFRNTTTKRVNLTAGDQTQVLGNFFEDVAANVSIAGGYTKSGAADTWRNYVTDTAAFIVTVPA